MQNNPDGIVLLAKKSGPTSFSSLHDIKKALNTTKVGHTGTLDSFAQGLLVVCTGRLTKLAGNITEFNKTYKAVIKFGEQTDTLEPTGNIIKTAELPDLSELKAALTKFSGKIMQAPPEFSAIHINGKRASDLARKGIETEMPSRSVTVFSYDLQDVLLTEDQKVQYALIEFSVSKGTYIRSLARDIGQACGSCAYLVGLYRTTVGNFNIKDAAGFNKLNDFTIKEAIKTEKYYKNISNESKQVEKAPIDLELQKEIIEKKQSFSESTSILCGFYNIHLVNQEAYAEFKNGKPLKNKLFIEDLYKIPCNSLNAVFIDDFFVGLLEKNNEGKITYKFVIN